MSKITEQDYAEYLELIAEDYSQRKACEILGIPRSSMQDFIKRMESSEVEGSVSTTRNPVIAFYDLECMPSVSVSFGRWKQNIGVDNVLEEGAWLISAVVSINGVVTSLCLTPQEALDRDDSRIVANLYEIFEGVDIAVAQNGDRFDWPLFKTRCIKNGFNPPKTVKHIDTLKIAKQLKFNSNRLDSLGKELGLGRKIQHSGIDLWIRCMRGEQDALDQMLEYNEQDVVLLQQVYYKLRAFDSKHPNVSHFYSDDKTRCPVCGSEDLVLTGNSVYTPVSEFAEVACGSCGHRSRKRQAINTKDKRLNLLISPKTTG